MGSIMLRRLSQKIFCLVRVADVGAVDFGELAGEAAAAGIAAVDDAVGAEFAHGHLGVAGGGVAAGEVSGERF